LRRARSDISKQIYIALSIVLFNFCLPRFCYSQSVSQVFEHIPFGERFPQSIINSIRQDSRGFLWILTQDGIYKFDGYEFHQFNRDSNNNSLPDVTTTAFMEDPFGNIWIGTRTGSLFQIENQTNKISIFKIKPDKLYPDNQTIQFQVPPCYSRFDRKTITSICCDKDANLWIGTWGTGLFKFDTEKNEFTEHLYQNKDENSISSDYILSIVEDKYGAIWAGYFKDGLDKITTHKDKKGNRKYSITNYSSGSNVTSLLVDSKDKNVLWFGTYGRGLNKIFYSNESGKDSFVPDTNQNVQPLVNFKITRICQDTSGNLWLGTVNDGLVQFNTRNNQIKIFRNDPLNPESIDDNDIISLEVDRTGLVWVGTLSGFGLNKLHPEKRKIQHFKSEPNNLNSLSGNVVYPFAEDKDGNIWIGTYKNGLTKFNSKEKSFGRNPLCIINSDNQTINHITSL